MNFSSFLKHFIIEYFIFTYVNFSLSATLFYSDFNDSTGFFFGIAFEILFPRWPLRVDYQLQYRYKVLWICVLRNFSSLDFWFSWCLFLINLINIMFHLMILFSFKVLRKWKKKTKSVIFNLSSSPYHAPVVSLVTK